MSSRFNLRKRKLLYSNDNIPNKKEKSEALTSLDNIKLENNGNLKECYVVLKKSKDEFSHEIEFKKPFKEKDAENTTNNIYENCENSDKIISKNPRPVIRSHSKIQCKICHYKFTKYYFSKHHCDNVFHCKRCDKTFERQFRLDKHLGWHAKMDARLKLPESEPCPICQKDIKRYNIKRHARYHENKVPKVKIIKPPMKKKMKNFVCNICNKNCKCKLRFEKHIKNYHEEQNFKCEECPESFKYLVVLARHVSQVHRKISSGKTKCPFCKKEVVNISTHMTIHKTHSMKCEICNATLHNYFAYKSHIQCHKKLAAKGRDRPIVPWSVISASKPFKCDICSKRTATENELQSHKRRHHHVLQLYLDTRMKQIYHSCNACDFKANSPLDLYFHLCSVHTTISDAEFRCFFCDEIVKLKYLSFHLRCHSKSKYTCEICTEHFCTSQDYTNHCIRFHKLKRKCWESDSSDSSNN